MPAVQLRIKFSLSLSLSLSTRDFIGAKGDGGGGHNWNYKACKTRVKSSPPTNQRSTSTFYRPDVLPVAQPTVSKHWTEITHGTERTKITITTRVRHFSAEYVRQERSNPGKLPTRPSLSVTRILLLLLLVWRFSVAVTRFDRSTQLLYIEPG